MSVSRRNFLKTGGAGLVGAGIAAQSSTAAATLGRPTEPEEPNKGFFSYGVASGDPTEEAVILWTHFEPANGEPVTVDWKIALDSGMSQVVNSGQFDTDVSRGFTVKVDADGLDADTTYYYQFSALDQTSEVGRTKTAMTGSPDMARFAVVSCSSYAHGYFNVYRALSQRDDLNAVIHLGDYIYEYAQNDYDEILLRNKRALAPAHEIVTLSDYRRRHALYKLDPDLQAVHAAHPFIPVWDDHEFTNDAWVGGAENHNEDEGEGDWFERKDIARQVYFEWMPIRESEDGSIKRRVQYGDLLDLFMLDTRIEGRDEQTEFVGGQREARDENRTLLGFDQEDWLYNHLNNSTAKWKLLGQQVMMAQTHVLDIDRYFRDDKIVSVLMDSWDGYAANRSRLLDTIENNNIDNVVVLTGDIHSSWASDIARDPYEWWNYGPITGRGSLAVEFVCPAVTSPAVPAPLTEAAEAFVRSKSPHVKYVELTTRGFILLTVDREKVQSDWYYVPSVLVPSSKTYCGASYQCKDGQARVTKARRPA